MGEGVGKLLVVVAGAHRVGLPLARVQETMRPLPIEPLRDALPFVLGLSIIRGAPTSVLDLGALLGREEHPERFLRFVTLDLGERSVALAVEAALEVVEVDDETFSSLPPLLTQAAGEAVRALCLVDDKLLLVLEATKLVPYLGIEVAS